MSEWIIPYHLEMMAREVWPLNFINDPLPVAHDHPRCPTHEEVKRAEENHPLINLELRAGIQELITRIAMREIENPHLIEETRRGYIDDSGRFRFEQKTIS